MQVQGFLGGLGRPLGQHVKGREVVVAGCPPQSPSAPLPPPGRPQGPADGRVGGAGHGRPADRHNRRAQQRAPAGGRAVCRTGLGTRQPHPPSSLKSVQTPDQHDEHRMRLALYHQALRRMDQEAKRQCLACWSLPGWGELVPAYCWRGREAARPPRRVSSPVARPATARPSKSGRHAGGLSTVSCKWETLSAGCPTRPAGACTA